MLCQLGDHETLLCELHGARLKGSFFYQNWGPTVKLKDWEATRGTRSTSNSIKCKARSTAVLTV